MMILVKRIIICQCIFPYPVTVIRCILAQCTDGVELSAGSGIYRIIGLHFLVGEGASEAGAGRQVVGKLNLSKSISVEIIILSGLVKIIQLNLRVIYCVTNLWC